MKKLAIIFVLFFGQIIYSQQTNISHRVVSGETLSKIAQKYKVTPYDIIQLNPSVVNGVKENDVLIIPISAVVSSSVPASNTSIVPPVSKKSSEKNASVPASNAPIVQPASKIATEKNANVPASNASVQPVLKSSSEKNAGVLVHIVQSGETKYGISKLYGVTIPQLEEQNPHIIAGLQAGHKLHIKNSTTGYKQDLSQLSTTVFDSKFDYVVLPGETLYGISKRNGLTVDELVRANTSVLKGVLKSGQRLTIPVKKRTTVVPSVQVVSSSDSKYHIVEPRETKYGLSKMYGVTIEQLESLNPHIVKGLQIGQKITIPDSYVAKEVVAENPTPKKAKEAAPVVKVEETKTTDVKSSKDASNQEYVDYEIQPKETLFGLAKKAGMPIKDFVELNPKLENAVQIGMIIKMPKNANVDSTSSPDVVVAKEEKGEESKEPKETVVKSSSRYKDLATTVDTSVKKQMILAMPFNEAKYQNYVASSSDFKNVKDEFLKSNLEFYSGALRAIDSAKTLGLNFDVKLVELQNNDTNEANIAKLKEADLTNSSVIVLPYYEKIAAEVASNVSTEKLPVITNQLANETVGYPNLYLSVPSDTDIRGYVLDYLKSKNANVIVVNGNNRDESKNAIAAKFPEAKYAKISDRNVIDTDDLKKSLVKDKLNYVILDVDKNSMIISSTNVLLSELSEFQIQIVVLEPSLLSNYENVSSIRINILKLIYPSYSSVEQSAQLDNSIKRMMKGSNVKPSHDFLVGFDLTLDVLLRMSQTKDFGTSTEEDVTEYLKFKFEYNKDKVGNNANRGFYILQHDGDTQINELKN